jgi:hypothetical protein
MLAAADGPPNTVPDHARHRMTPEGRQQVVLVAVALAR